MFMMLKLPKDRGVEFQLAKATGPPIVTSKLLKNCLVCNLDRIDNDDDDRMALSSVLPNASLCLDCGASRIAVTLFVYRRTYSTTSSTCTDCTACRTYSTTCSTCTTCTACRVELAHLAQLVLVLIVAPTRIAVTLFVTH